MTRQRYPLIAAAAIAATALQSYWQPVLAQTAPPSPDAKTPEIVTPKVDGAVGDDGVEVRTRGPIHEAFAAPYAGDPIPGIVVNKEPPPAINEIAPETAPSGGNVQWIPGYWGWDDEGDDFIWISGVWRHVPPDQRWVPGYWTKVDAGFQWIAGFWTSSRANELAYQPEPPESLEQGPTSEAPSADHFWVPGCWQYANNDYGWRAGYWARGYDDWVWSPAQYAWTPQGYLYNNGYWDYRLANRGVMFAPLSFRRGYSGYGNYRYSPNIVLSLGSSLLHLFVRQPYSHYYYGDYYGSRYSNWGLQPWYRYNGYRSQYDPLFSFYSRTHRRQGINLFDRMNRWNNYYDNHRDARPSHTFAQQRRYSQERRGGQYTDLAVFSQPLNEFASRSNNGRGFFRVPNDRREDLGRGVEAFRRIEDQRRDIEQPGPRRNDGDRRTVGDGRNDNDRGNDGDRGNRFVNGRRLQLPQTIETLRPVPAQQQPQSTQPGFINRDGQRGFINRDGQRGVINRDAQRGIQDSNRFRQFQQPGQRPDSRRQIGPIQRQPQTRENPFKNRSTPRNIVPESRSRSRSRGSIQTPSRSTRQPTPPPQRRSIGPQPSSGSSKPEVPFKNNAKARNNQRGKGK